MTFTVAAALAIAVLVVAPIAAHLLRRGRVHAHEFPPAALVSAVAPAAQQIRRLGDRGLLVIRISILLVLAVLGATPLVRCSRLSISHSSGASVAVAVVLDDSMSMRARLANGKTRWETALDAAHQLIDSMSNGDAMAVVLAGRPARLALGATTNLHAGRSAIAELRPSDRATDLAAALALAKSTLERLPHRDKRVLLLSDLAVRELPSSEPLWAPLTALRQPVADCGVVRAQRRGRRISADVVCNARSAAEGRHAELVSGARSPLGELGGVRARAPKERTLRNAPPERTSAAVAAESGVQTVAFETDQDVDLDVVLSGQDAIGENDRAPVAPRPRSLAVAVVADPAKATPITGAATVIEEAVHALSDKLSVRPIPSLPDDLKTLETYGALVLDDPAGFAPEARLALGRWLEQGGVALAFLGPSSAQASLGSTLEPLLSGPVRWETAQVAGADAASYGWLGAEATSLEDLAPRGRLRFEGAVPAQSRIVGRWLDGVPMAIEHRVGLGQWLALGLPCSVDESELALRPGFLAVVDHMLRLAARHNGVRVTTPGTAWTFDNGSVVQIIGPRGKLSARVLAATDDHGGARRLVAAPEEAGRYKVTNNGRSEQRFVTLDPEEVETMPVQIAGRRSRLLVAPTSEHVDVSRAVAWLLVGLLGAELAFRGALRWQTRAARRSGRTFGSTDG
ncbi:MAG: VWA domain-containing protein [Polyangiaceae bacterium]|nr:VWA domain-containing protein [Polyangiaceae bacterium]